MLQVFIINKYIMKEVIKNNIKELSIMALAFGIFVAVALYVPDDSIFKQIFAGFIVLVLIASAVLLTPLGNPLKRIYRKWKGLDK
jgi:hypothetical protein